MKPCRWCKTQYVASHAHRLYCKDSCRDAAEVAGRNAYRERIDWKAYMKKYYAEHKSYFQAHNKAHYAANTESEKKRSVAWQKKNPKKNRAINLAATTRYRATPKGRTAAIADHARRRGKLTDAGKVDLAAWRAKLKRLGNRCTDCRKVGKTEMDHDLPISKGGTNDIRNLLPRCKPCNMAKGAKIRSNTQLRLV